MEKLQIESFDSSLSHQELSQIKGGSTATCLVPVIIKAQIALVKAVNKAGQEAMKDKKP